jgi:plasmid stabilization system protein ParE
LKQRGVAWSRDALDELKESIAYIARDNPAAARRVAAAIKACGRGLGAAATGRRGRVTGTHEKVVPGLPYILAYVIEEAITGRERIVILRVIHGARDWRDDAWPE